MTAENAQERARVQPGLLSLRVATLLVKRLFSKVCRVLSGRDRLVLSTVRPLGAGPDCRVAPHREPIVRLKQLFTVALQPRLWTTTSDFSGVGDKNLKEFSTTTTLGSPKSPCSVITRP